MHEGAVMWDIEKRRAAYRKYYRAHREEILKKHREGYAISRMANPCREMLVKAKHRAKKAGLDFNVGLEDVVIPKVCPVLGIPIIRGTGSRPSPNSPSLDRIDPAKGYVKGNVMVISNRANTLKNNASADELRKVADYVDKYLRLN
jgi:hypothetical protein